jgi:hypothetical protein
MLRRRKIVYAPAITIKKIGAGQGLKFPTEMLPQEINGVRILWEWRAENPSSALGSGGREGSKQVKSIKRVEDLSREQSEAMDTSEAIMEMSGPLRRDDRFLRELLFLWKTG